MDFKYTGTIELREGMDYWGPYTFDVSAVMPPDQALADVKIQVFEGKITEKNFTMSNVSDISSLVIDAYDVVANTISMYLQYPGEAYSGKTLTIQFMLTTDLSVSTNYFPVYFTNIKVL